jgi:hypothetical protein
VREEGIPPNLAESPITPLRQAQQAELASWVSKARLPRTEPSTELISAHKVNHRAPLRFGINFARVSKVAP